MQPDYSKLSSRERELMGLDRPDRKEAEQAYVENHDISTDPIGSPKWVDYWKGWQHARNVLPFTLGELAAMVQNPATLLALAAQHELWALELSGGAEVDGQNPHTVRMQHLLNLAHEVDAAMRKLPEQPEKADPNKTMGAFRVMPYPANDKVLPGRALIIDASGGYLGTSNGFPHMGTPALFPEEQAVAIVCAVNLVFHGIGAQHVRELLNDPNTLPLAFWSAFPTTH